MQKQLRMFLLYIPMYHGMVVENLKSNIHVSFFQRSVKIQNLSWSRTTLTFVSVYAIWEKRKGKKNRLTNFFPVCYLVKNTKKSTEFTQSNMLPNAMLSRMRLFLVNFQYELSTISSILTIFKVPQKSRMLVYTYNHVHFDEHLICSFGATCTY